MANGYEWWFDTADEGEFGSARSRDDAISQGLADVDIGESFKIIEAVCSDDPEYEGADYVPFIATRNAEWVKKTADGFEVSPA